MEHGPVGGAAEAVDGVAHVGWAEEAFDHGCGAREVGSGAFV